MSVTKFSNFPANPDLICGCIREPNDAVALFHDMLRTRPCSIVVKIKQYSVALYAFDKMLQRDARVNHYTFSIVIKCFCFLNRVVLGFLILGSFFNRGCGPNVVTFNNLINGLRKISEAANELLMVKLCESNEITHFTVMNVLCCKMGDVNPISYTTLIDGLCKHQIIDEVLQLFSTLFDNN